MAVGGEGRRLTSSDGEHWTNDQRSSDKDTLFNIAYGLGRFIAVGGGPKTGRLLSSADGKTWKALPAVPGCVATIAFGNGRFVAGHDAQLLSSTDGETFVPGEKLEFHGTIHARRSAFGSGEAGPRFVIIGDVDLEETGTRVSWRASTETGERYTSQALDTAPALDVAYGAGHFVVVGPNGLIESSHDGQIWLRHPSDPAEDFSRVIWTGQRFLISGGKKTWSSSDGVNWSAELDRLPGVLIWAEESATTRILTQSSDGALAFSLDLLHWRKPAVNSGPALEALAYSEQ